MENCCTAPEPKPQPAKTHYNCRQFVAAVTNDERMNLPVLFRQWLVVQCFRFTCLKCLLIHTSIHRSVVVVSIKSEAIFKCTFFWVEISRNAAQVLWGEENNNAAAANDDDDDDDG